jgi:alcohol dehydrogenase
MKSDKTKVMKAWRLEKLGGRLDLKEVPVPQIRAGSVLVKVENVSLVSYLRSYTEGKLPVYNPPGQEFTMGSNAIGHIQEIGQDVWHLKPGQRVVVSSHITAGENVEDPAMILLGITRAGDGAIPVQKDWPDGTLAEYVLVPAEAITPLDGLEQFDAAQIAAITRMVVPYGGLLKGQLAAGETIIVNGATGSYGTTAVLLAVAMGAAKVIAAGRNEATLAAVAKAGGKRVLPVKLTGDVQTDTQALRTAAGGGAHLAFDQVGNAKDPNSTLASLFSLRRGGRLVLMGSMTTDLPIPYTMLMINSWQIIGNFMYPPGAFARMLDLIRSGLLDITPIQPKVFPLEQLNEAMDAAAAAGNFDNIIVNCIPKN